MHGDRKAALGRDGSGNMEIEGLATELGKEKNIIIFEESV